MLFCSQCTTDTASSPPDESWVKRRPPQLHPQIPLHHPRLAHLLPAHRALAQRLRLADLEQPLLDASPAYAVPARHDAHPRAAPEAHEALLEVPVVLLLRFHLVILLLLLFFLLLLLLLSRLLATAAAAATRADFSLILDVI